MKYETGKIIGELSGTVVISVLSGLIGAVFVKGFMAGLEKVSAAAAGVESVPGYIMPLAGALITGGLILRFRPGAGGDGTNDYIEAVNRRGGNYSMADTLAKIPATLITLGLYGSGGIVGTLSRIGSGLSSYICSKIISLLRIPDQDSMRTAAVCGMSAVVSAIFHSPLGGALFATEITRKNSIIYPDLFPAILTGCAAVYTSNLIGLEPVFALTPPAFSNGIGSIALSSLAALISGGVGILFIASFNRMKEVFNAIPCRQPAQAALAGVILSILFAAGASGVLGTSIDLFDSFASFDTASLSSSPFYTVNIFLFAGLLLILKLAATSITVGSGLSGGVTGPLIIIGTCFAASFCSAAGIPGGSGIYYAVLCACISGILSSALNIPIAAAMITVAIFDHSYIIPAVAGSILPFSLFKGKTVFLYNEDEQTDLPEEEQGITLNGRKDQ